MSTDKAAEIVRQAMADRSIYDAMAVRENELWGKILPDRERSETAVAYMKAGAELRVNRLSIMKQLLAVLPEKFRKNKITGQFVTEIKRPEPGHLSSPFESIRSSEIVPLFQHWFTTEWKLENNAFLQLIAPPGTRAAYLENEDTKALFEVLMLLDDLCIKEKVVQPTGGQYLMRPRLPNDIGQDYPK